MAKINLRGYYQELKEKNPQNVFRNEVIAKTGMSRSMFYNYIMNRWPVPDIYKKAFAEAANVDVKDLFSDFTYHDKCQS